MAPFRNILTWKIVTTSHFIKFPMTVSTANPPLIFSRLRKLSFLIDQSLLIAFLFSMHQQLLVLQLITVTSFRET